ncbi:MAG: hypothetical protein WEB53_08605 [Akkermansiaceae bacterium]
MILVDFADSQPKRLFVDADGDGDLTDDPSCDFTTQEAGRPDGKKSASDHASAMINVTADGKHRGKVHFRRIRSIPHMILVDGDTGTILANKTIRGPALAAAIEKALAAKAAAIPHD